MPRLNHVCLMSNKVQSEDKKRTNKEKNGPCVLEIDAKGIPPDSESQGVVCDVITLNQ